MFRYILRSLVTVRKLNKSALGVLLLAFIKEEPRKVVDTVVAQIKERPYEYIMLTLRALESEDVPQLIDNIAKNRLPQLPIELEQGYKQAIAKAKGDIDEELFIPMAAHLLLYRLAQTVNAYLLTGDSLAKEGTLNVLRGITLHYTFLEKVVLTEVTNV